MIENIQVKPGVEAARVIINSRTGTVVIGADVKVSGQQQSHTVTWWLKYLKRRKFLNRMPLPAVQHKVDTVITIKYSKLGNKSNDEVSKRRYVG